MPRITIIGGGTCGLLTATLLAQQGNDVTVLERDPAPPLTTAAESWEHWERRGVAQFRLLHFLQPRFRQEIDDELPELAAEMQRLGAVRFGVAGYDAAFTGGPRDGDDRYDTLTGRRPMIETAIAAVVARTPGVTVRRGAPVAGLLEGTGRRPGTRHVGGVRLESGEQIESDLVVDAGGRRSGLVRLLEELGTRAPYEEQDDLGFVYYGRHFRSSDGSVPTMSGPVLSNCGTFSTLTLPADNGTWGLGIIAAGADKELRGLKDPDAWERVWRLVPHVAGWLDGEPIDDGVAVMANLPDRIRHLVVDGLPVATGVTAVADAWACTNPSVGRGITIGLLHAQCLRDVLGTAGLEDPFEFALAFDEATAARVEPWYRATVDMDRDRLEEVMYLREHGAPPPVASPQAAMRDAFFKGAWSDPDLFRAFAAIGGMLSTPEEVLSDPAIFERVLASAEADWPFSAPTRGELLAQVR